MLAGISESHRSHVMQDPVYIYYIHIYIYIHFFAVVRYLQKLAMYNLSLCNLGRLLDKSQQVVQTITSSGRKRSHQVVGTHCYVQKDINKLKLLFPMIQVLICLAETLTCKL